MRNREKLLLRNEKRKFVIRRRFPPLFSPSPFPASGVSLARTRRDLVLGGWLFLSMLETLFSLLYPSELGLSCLFQWTVAPLHGGWIQHSINGGRQRVGLLNRAGRQVVRAFDYIDWMLLSALWTMLRANYFSVIFFLFINSTTACSRFCWNLLNYEDLTILSC